MARLEILTWPHPVLKKKSVEVKDITSELTTLVQDMLETMYDSNGVGLAAPQIGRNIRLVVIDTRPRDEENRILEDEMTDLERAIQYPLVLFNPQILRKRERWTYEEGCLSVPGFVEEVERSKIIDVRAQDETGNWITFQTDGLLSVCIQHELDHLDGKLFIDRLSPLKSGIIKSKIKKHGYPTESLSAGDSAT